MPDEPTATQKMPPASVGIESCFPETTKATEANPKPIGTAIDSVSKAAALCIALIYVSGFLITSLNDFRYGFSEMNPFRPRILAAGGWLFLFLAIPFELTRALLKHKVWNENQERWFKAASLLFVYYTSAVFISLVSGAILVFDQTGGGKPVEVTAWQIAVGVAALIGIIVIAVLYTHFSEKIPSRVRAVLVFAFYGYLIWQGYDTVFVKQHFDQRAPQLWLLALGVIFLLEMKSRSWKPRLGDWPYSVILFLGTLTVFGTIYYPHIKASYGGGAVIPVQITFNKEFPSMPNQTVACMLIDETDSGFYVIGKDEKHASFIPRSAVTLIHFADASEPSIFIPKTK